MHPFVLFPQPSRAVERVPTPQPTPRTSPIPGYVSHHAPATPPLTPPPPPLPPRDRSPVKDVSSESSAPGAALVSAATSMTPQLEAAPQAAAIVYESETEVSASLDISEELRALDGEGATGDSFCLLAWRWLLCLAPTALCDSSCFVWLQVGHGVSLLRTWPSQHTLPRRRKGST